MLELLQLEEDRMTRRGLLKNADGILPSGIITALDQAFRDYEENIHGHKVKEPGKELLAQLEEESHLDTKVADRYLKQLNAVIAAAQADTHLPFGCCDHHKSRYETIRGNLLHQLTGMCQ